MRKTKYTVKYTTHDKRMNALTAQIIQSISFKKIILLPDTVLAEG